MAGGASEDGEEINSINVTPLVDITLVLLIIFMVTAKIIVSQSIPLDLPKAASGQEVQTVFSIILAADGTTQVDSHPVDNDEAITALSKDARTKNPELRAVIKA
ncbi:MAG: biopolymer transporter ExbD, partial [Polyangiaceae bacterium]